MTADCLNVQNFVAYNEFCIRACKDGPKAPALCQHIYDVMGCSWNMPGDYSAGSFDSCRGDSGEARFYIDEYDISVLTVTISHSRWVCMVNPPSTKARRPPPRPTLLHRSRNATAPTRSPTANTSQPLRPSRRLLRPAAQRPALPLSVPLHLPPSLRPVRHPVGRAPRPPAPLARAHRPARP